VISLPKRPYHDLKQTKLMPACTCPCPAGEGHFLITFLGETRTCQHCSAIWDQVTVDLFLIALTPESERPQSCSLEPLQAVKTHRSSEHSERNMPYNTCTQACTQPCTSISKYGRHMVDAIIMNLDSYQQKLASRLQRLHQHLCLLQQACAIKSLQRELPG
jgi:hypothetical protein